MVAGYLIVTQDLALDQGTQSTGGRHQSVLEAHGIQPSMNSVGNWYDKAPRASLFVTLKREL